MSGEIDAVLAQLEDPGTIEEVRRAANKGDPTASNADPQQQRSLRDLYETFLDRRTDRSPATRRQYRETIPDFIEFTEEKGRVAPSEITPILLDDYVDLLNERYDRDASVHKYTKNIRTWLKWLSKRNLCEEEAYGVLDKDSLGLSPNARDEAPSIAETKAILENLRQNRYGSQQHALTEVLSDAGPRIGGVYSLDIGDFHPKRNELEFRHRPDTGTRLKNGGTDSNSEGDGERFVTISQSTVKALIAYIESSDNRPDVTDEYGRKPLFATSQGRASRATLRRWVYQATSCRWANTELLEVDCDGNCSPDSDICSCSYYPHALRRGAIVHRLSNGLAPHRASERFDVSPKVIEKHYDPRTKRQRKDDRAEAVRSSTPDYS